MSGFVTSLGVSLVAVALGTTGPADGGAGVVTLTPAAGVALRLSDVKKPPHRPVLPVELSTPGAAYGGLFMVCVGASGEVTGAEVLRSTGHAEVLDARWLTAIRTWRYAPYKPEGGPAPFCHAIRLDVRVHAAGGTTVASPPDAGAPGAAVILAPAIGQGLRLTDVTRAPYRPVLPPELNNAGNVFWGLFKICVATSGEVTGISVLRSTGEPQLLDTPWTTVMKTWRYRPYTIDGRPVPFCHPVRLQVQSG